ncbi:hypothetical protein Y695_03985 [Hydrogenophaga sp. T4]|nr:hypothetical protein Y695_03985 [Hydrogenophaga sp. T4]
MRGRACWRVYFQALPSRFSSTICAMRGSQSATMPGAITTSTSRAGSRWYSWRSTSRASSLRFTSVRCKVPWLTRANASRSVMSRFMRATEPATRCSRSSSSGVRRPAICSRSRCMKPSIERSGDFRSCDTV